MKLKPTKQTASIKTRYEHFAINHDGVRVDVIVDYNYMTVSIVNNTRDKKEYMFCGRWSNYEQWRYKILDAIKEAMRIWFVKLDERRHSDELDIAERMIAQIE